MYDWLPSIIRSLSPSIKALCYCSNAEILSYTLSFLLLTIQQGLVYGVNWVEPVIRHATTPNRTVAHRRTIHA